MYNFLRKFPDRVLVNGTITFVKSVGKDSKRKVDPEIWDALQIDFKGVEQAVYVRFGLIAALYTEAKPGSATTLIAATAIRQLGSDKKIKQTLAADKTLQEFGNRIRTNPDLKDNTAAWMAYTNLCSDIGCMCCDKNPAKVTEHIRSMGQPADLIVHAGHLQFLCVQRILESCSVSLTDDFNEFEICKKADSKKQQDNTHEIQPRQLDDITPNMMRELGFKVDDTITPSKKEKGTVITKLRITSIMNGKISVVDESLKQPGTPIDLVEFQTKKWKHLAVVEDEWREYSVTHSKHDTAASHQKIVTCAAIVAIHNAWQEETLESNEIKFLMPRPVAANKTFKANDLVLSPGSQSVSL